MLGDVLHPVKHFALPHDTKIIERVTLGKSVGLHFPHFDEGRNAFAGAPPLLPLRLTRSTCLAPLLLLARLGLFRHGCAVDRQLPRLDLPAKLLADGGHLLRALAKQASVQRFHLLGELLDDFTVLGELLAKRRILLAQMRHQEAHRRFERFQIVNVAGRHRQT